MANDSQLPEVNFKLAIPSRGRAGRVISHKHFELPALLVVPSEEVGEYSMMHPECRVLGQVGKGIAAARNTILDELTGSNVLQLDDDVTEIGAYLDGGKKQVLIGEPLRDLVGQLFGLAKFYGSWYFGCSPTSNAFYYDSRKRLSFNLFVNGSFSGYLTGCPLRFDTNLPLKEDYDFTLQAWKACRKVLRFNFVYADAAHRSNKGGAVDYRTAQLEEQAITYLRQKWGKFIRDNPRRPHEILLRLPSRRLGNG